MVAILFWQKKFDNSQMKSAQIMFCEFPPCGEVQVKFAAKLNAGAVFAAPVALSFLSRV